jgi:peptidoglycan-N-acetylglucosamine deacetylase
MGSPRTAAPVLIAGGLAAWSLPAAAKASAGFGALLGVRSRLGGRNAVTLTFDDGPHPDGTPAALEALAAAGVRATFFLVGEQVERHPALAREVVAAGHAIALHCHRHRNLLRLTPRQAREDLERAEAAIEDATGQAIDHYRPPYGILAWPALAHARRRGWTVLLWSGDGRDWSSRATPASIAARALRGAGPGSVILLHDSDAYSASLSWRRTAGALPLLFEGLGRLGLEAGAA